MLLDGKSGAPPDAGAVDVVEAEVDGAALDALGVGSWVTDSADDAPLEAFRFGSTVGSSSARAHAPSNANNAM